MKRKRKCVREYNGNTDIKNLTIERTWDAVCCWILLVKYYHQRQQNNTNRKYQPRPAEDYIELLITKDIPVLRQPIRKEWIQKVAPTERDVKSTNAEKVLIISIFTNIVLATALIVIMYELNR